MSFEAMARVRKKGAIGAFETKWLTVQTDCPADAQRQFSAMGYETAGLRIMTQEEATRIAEIIARN